MPILTNRGVRLPQQKQPAAGRPIEELDDCAKVYLPLSFSGEAEAAKRCVLHRYTSVLQGQAVVRPRDPLGAPVLASVSGVYTDRRRFDHPVYGPVDCLVMDCMDARRPVPDGEEATDTETLTAAQIVDIARQHAVRDELDGACVSDKLYAWAQEGCDVLVGDAVENQPYASAAGAVLRENALQVMAGLRLAARAVGAPASHLAVPPLPAESRRALRRQVGEEAVFTVRRRYPAAACTAKPFGKRVRRIGVQALLALYHAAAFDEPHTAGVVTVAGGAVSSPRNLRVPFGAPATTLFRRCGLLADPTLIVFGDMMTGQAVEDPETPVLPGVTCLLALTDSPRAKPDVCVGCGRCIQVCHAGLMPCAILRERERPGRAAALQAGECDRCGACSAVCPAGLELSALVFAAGQEARRAENMPKGEDEP